MNSPEFAQRFQGDEDFREAFHRGYVDRTDENLGGYIDALKGSALTGSVGGSPITVVPKSVRSVADDIFGKTEAQEAKRLGYGLERTPNKGYMDWFNFVNQQVAKENALRFGIPSSTAKAEYDAPFDLPGLLEALTPLYKTPEKTSPILGGLGYASGWDT